MHWGWTSRVITVVFGNPMAFISFLLHFFCRTQKIFAWEKEMQSKGKISFPFPLDFSFCTQSPTLKFLSFPLHSVSPSRRKKKQGIGETIWDGSELYPKLIFLSRLLAWISWWRNKSDAPNVTLSGCLPWNRSSLVSHQNTEILYIPQGESRASLPQHTHW